MLGDIADAITNASRRIEANLERVVKLLEENLEEQRAIRALLEKPKLSIVAQPSQR